MRAACFVPAWGFLLVGLGIAAEPPPEAPPIVHTVSRHRPMAYSTYVPDKEKALVVVLKTVLPETEIDLEFNTGTLPERPASRIIACRRHGEAVWKITAEEKREITAKSPRLEKNEPTHVIAAGRFVRPSKAAPPGPAGGAAPPAEAPPPVPDWRSVLKARGTHVLVINQYDVERDKTHDPKAGSPSFNWLILNCGLVLHGSYPPEDHGSRRIVVLCGLGQEGDSSRINSIEDRPC